MSTKPSPAAQRIINLKVGKTCVVGSNPAGLIATAKRHCPEATFTRANVDGGHVITRTA